MINAIQPGTIKKIDTRDLALVHVVILFLLYYYQFDLQ